MQHYVNIFKLFQNGLLTSSVFNLALTINLHRLWIHMVCSAWIFQIHNSFSGHRILNWSAFHFTNVLPISSTILRGSNLPVDLTICDTVLADFTRCPCLGCSHLYELWRVGLRNILSFSGWYRPKGTWTHKQGRLRPLKRSRSGHFFLFLFFFWKKVLSYAWRPPIEEDVISLMSLPPTWEARLRALEGRRVSEKRPLWALIFASSITHLTSEMQWTQSKISEAKLWLCVCKKPLFNPWLKKANRIELS